MSKAKEDDEAEVKSEESKSEETSEESKAEATESEATKAEASEGDGPEGEASSDDESNDDGPEAEAVQAKPAEKVAEPAPAPPAEVVDLGPDFSHDGAPDPVVGLGSDGTYDFFGHSAIIDPWGNAIVEGGESEILLTATIDTEMVAQVREKIPVFKDRRPELYQLD